MIKLVILRHAKTNQFSETGSDFDRKLLPRGVNQGKELEIFFAKTGFDIEEIHVSSAKRTRETFELIEKSVAGAQVQFWDHLYLADAHEILSFICQLNHSKTILLVGHNFGISDLVEYLTDEPIMLATSELVEITFDLDSWNQLSKSTGSISRRFRPMA